MNKKYDVIIIGSGIGGLAAAGLLSKNKKVLILEKNNTFGGYCAGFQRDGFKFESAIQAINGLYKDSIVYEVFKKCENGKDVETVMPIQLYRTVFPEHDIRVPQRDLKKYKDILSNRFPKEKDGMINLFATMTSIFREMNQFHMYKSFKKSPYMLRYSKRSLEQLLNEFIKSTELKAIISQYWIYRGLPPSKLSAMTFAYIWHDYTVNGSYYPKERMDGLISNIVNCIRKNGGDVISKKEVVKIYVCKGKVDGVEVRDSGKIKASMYISNMDVFKTFEMIDAKDDEEIKCFLTKLKRRSTSISGFKIYLGLSVDLKKIGITEYETFLNPGYDIEKMYAASIKNDLAQTTHSITVHSNIIDSFCDKNCSVVSIGLLSGYDFWRRLTSAEYKKTKEEMAEHAIIKAEKAIPNLRNYIKLKIISTPLTMERYTGNRNGSIYGWVKKSPSVREIAYINPTTPIKNLMLASHWTKMGGGVGGAVLSAERAYSLIK